MNKTKTGIIGAGAISDTYLTNIQKLFPWLELVCISAAHLERAKIKAEKYGIRAVATDRLLADKEISLVIILTPVDTHYTLIKQALEAGKHVYTEKTVTETTTQARELMELAKSKGLYLGSAPDTFMGSAITAAKKALDEGIIGEVNSFSISINRNNDQLTGWFPFLRLPGAGALRDYMVYYLTALVFLLGEADRVSAFVRAPYTKRINMVPGSDSFGKEISTPNESIITANIEMKSGVIGTIHENNESVMADRAEFAIYGTTGILMPGNPNSFGEPVKIVRSEGWEPSTVELPFGSSLLRPL